MLRTFDLTVDYIENCEVANSKNRVAKCDQYPHVCGTMYWYQLDGHFSYYVHLVFGGEVSWQYDRYFNDFDGLVEGVVGNGMPKSKSVF